jgi:hypothetical protein
VTADISMVSSSFLYAADWILHISERRFIKHKLYTVSDEIDFSEDVLAFMLLKSVTYDWIRQNGQRVV